MLEACSSGLLVALIAFGAPQRGFRFLDQPVISFYGRISYSFYLLHMIGLSIAVRICTIDGWPMLSILLSIVLGVLLTTPMAWMSWRFIEKPFIAIGKKWRDRRREVLTTT